MALGREQQRQPDYWVPAPGQAARCALPSSLCPVLRTGSEAGVDSAFLTFRQGVTH